MLESLSTEQLEFIKAIERYKNDKKKLFLSWSEAVSYTHLTLPTKA